MLSLDTPGPTDTMLPRPPPPWLAPARLRFLAIGWIVIAAAGYLWDLASKTQARLTNGAGFAFGDDFINYWSGAWLAWHGRSGEIYDWMAFHVFQQAVVGPAIQLYHYGYPPVLLVLTAPLAAIPYVPAVGLWLVSSWYAFYRALRLTAIEHAMLLSLATPALLLNATTGQNGAWTAALLGGGLTLLDRRPVLAGILFGLLIYKPHLGIMLPVALVAGRCWRAIAAAANTAGVLVGLSVLLFGWDLWGAFLNRVLILRRVILEDGDYHRMLSVFVFGRRLGLGVDAAYALQAASAIAAATMVAWAWWKKAGLELRNALVVLGTCLATPYLQDYDLVVGTFVAVWLMLARDQLQISPRSLQMLQGLILTLPLPIFAAAFSKLTGYSIGPLVPGAAFIIVAGAVLRQCALAERQPGS
jgi:hypothetical protein